MEARDKVWKDVVKSEVLTPGDWSIDAYERAVTFNTMKLITRLDAKPLSLPIKSALVVEFHGYMFKSVMTSAGKFRGLKSNGTKTYAKTNRPVPMVALAALVAHSIPALPE